MWLLASSCQHGQPAAPATPALESAAQVFPNVALTDLTLHPVTVESTLRGRVGVVDLWATWCVACKEDHEVLERLKRAYPTEELAIVGVNQGEDAQRVREYTQSHAFSYDVWLDPEFKLSAALGETSLPVVYVIDSKGNLLHRAAGLNARTLEVIRREIERVRASRSTTATSDAHGQ